MLEVILHFMRTAKGWTIDEHGAIRLRQGKKVYCPLTYAYYKATKKYIPLRDGWRAKEYFSLPAEWLYACDYNDKIFDVERKHLLDAIDD